MNFDQWDNRFLHINAKEDTTERDAKLGKDIQGIEWNLLDLDRSRYRAERIGRYSDISSETHQSVPKEELTKVEEGSVFYKFRLNCRYAKCGLTHFQLRHLVQATSNHDVYFMDDNCIYHWNPVVTDKEGRRGMKTKIVDLSDREILVTSLDAYKNFVVVGGLRGEVVVKNVLTDEVLFDDKITFVENSITNFIQLVDPPNKSNTQAIISSNDEKVRIFDVTSSFSLSQTFSFDWAVNHATLSPCGKLICAAGDANDLVIVDVTSGKRVCTLKGHYDYPFGTSWHPTLPHLATGAQDQTTRLWDTRMFGKTIHVLPGRMASIRSLHYTVDGEFLVAAEAADFVHVYQVDKDYKREQLIDIFGEISGVGISPDASTMFIGIFDRTYASLLEFSKVRFGMIDSLLL